MDFCDLVLAGTEYLKQVVIFDNVLKFVKILKIFDFGFVR